MVCRACPIRRHCWDKGNCGTCDFGKAFINLNEKINKLKEKNQALEKENEKLKEELFYGEKRT